MKRSLAIFMFVFSLFILGACGNDETTFTRGSVDTHSEAPTEATDGTTPTIEEEAPAVEATPTLNPEENGDSYIVDGIDFSKYYNGETLEDALCTTNLDTMRLIVVSNRKVDRALSDGESFVMEKTEDFDGVYIFALYTPKMIKEIVSPISKPISHMDSGKYWTGDLAKYREHSGHSFFIDDDAIFKDYEFTISVIYEDGETETLTIYLTKDYIVGDDSDTANNDESDEIPSPNVYDGEGDTVLELDRMEHSWVLYVKGNDESGFFSVTGYDDKNNRTELFVLETDTYEGITLDPSQKTTSLEIKADGPWHIEQRSALSLDTISLGDIIQGEGDSVFVVTGYGDTAHIKGNESGSFFAVNTFGLEKNNVMVSTTDPYDGEVKIIGHPLYLQVLATGEWEIEFEW